MMRADGGFNQLNETPFRPSSRSDNFVSFQRTYCQLFSQQVTTFVGCMTYHLLPKEAQVANGASHKL
jgi:hypothetical protein